MSPKSQHVRFNGMVIMQQQTRPCPWASPATSGRPSSPGLCRRTGKYLSRRRMTTTTIQRDRVDGVEGRRTAWRDDTVFTQAAGPARVVNTGNGETYMLDADLGAVLFRGADVEAALH